MKARILLPGLFAALVMLGLGYAAWRLTSIRAQESCQACWRPIHAHTKTVGLLDGKRKLFCCPSCALSEQAQLGKSIDIVELSDFRTGAKLSPEQAYIVRDSDENPCLKPAPTVNPDKQPLQSHFDRCVPSMLAFAGKEEAVSFAEQHGGRVVRFAEVASSSR